MLGQRVTPSVASLVRLPGIRRLASGPQLNQLTRLAPVLELVREVDGTELLDAGSGSRGIAPWLPGWSVTAFDSSFDDYGAATGPRSGSARPVVGDIRAMPFDDRAFDVVVALDVLEHVIAEDRPAALEELARVAGRRLVVACPAGAAALASDRRLAETLPDPPGWLEEHLANGFPEADELVAALEPLGRVRLLANEYVPSHQRLVRAELSPLPALGLRLVAAALSSALRSGPSLRRAGERVLLWVRGHDRLPAYRAVIVLDLSPAHRPIGEGHHG